MRAAVVGCGLIASRWVRTILADGRLHIDALVDPDPAAAARLASRYSLDGPTYRRPDDAIATRRLDVVLNLTPPDLHATTSARALEAGLHVLAEKPLATSASDARHLVQLAHHHDRHLYVMQNRGRDPRWQFFADHIRAHDRGPLQVEADVTVALPAPGFRRSQRHAATTDLAIHAFDQIRRLIPADPVQVLAHETPLPFLAQHCCTTSITVRFADGSLLSYRGGFSAGPQPRSTPNGAWSITGRDVHAAWDGEHAAVLTTADHAPRSLRLPAGGQAYPACLTAMIDALLGAPGRYPPARDGIGSIVLLDAALTSIATGGPVSPDRSDDQDRGNG